MTSLETKDRLNDLILYLQHLGSDYQELIFACSRMLYNESPENVRTLFVGYAPTDGGAPIENELIMNHLRELTEHDETLKYQWKKNGLVMDFLRDLIQNKNEIRSLFHTQFVYRFMESITSLQELIDVLESTFDQVRHYYYYIF